MNEEVEDTCFGIHNFVTDEGGDTVDGPAHCTECGGSRLDVVKEVPVWE